MTSSSTEEQLEWNKIWREYLPEEARKRLNPTPEEKRLTEIKEGVLTIFTGVGAMIFLYFFFEAVAKRAGEGADIVRSLYWLGIVLVLVGAGMIFNGLFISQRLLKPKEQETQPPLFESSPEAAHAVAEPAKTTDQLVVDAASTVDYGALEAPTGRLPEPVAAPHVVKPTDEGRGSRVEG
jgi:hypothetical protein